MTAAVSSSRSAGRGREHPQLLAGPLLQERQLHLERVIASVRLVVDVGPGRHCGSPQPVVDRDLAERRQPAIRPGDRDAAEWREVGRSEQGDTERARLRSEDREPRRGDGPGEDVARVRHHEGAQLARHGPRPRLCKQPIDRRRQLRSAGGVETSGGDRRPRAVHEQAFPGETRGRRTQA